MHHLHRRRQQRDNTPPVTATTTITSVAYETSLCPTLTPTPNTRTIHPFFQMQQR
jgi:hypothetical protein